jgi:hypothetical protein
MKKQLLCLFALLNLAGGAFAQTIPSYVPTNGLVGWWPFNGNANDESGNENNGTAANVEFTSDRFGNSNASARFPDGNTNSNIQLGSHHYSTFSYSIWYKINIPTTHGFGVLASNYLDGNGFEIQIGGGNKLTFILSNGASWGSFMDTSAIELNKWHHIIVTFNGQFGKMYKNGNLVLNGLNTGTMTEVDSLFEPNFQPGNQQLTFGDRTNGNVFEFNFEGFLDDIAIYNRALSQQEITALYQGNNPVTSCPTLPANLQQGLAGYWPFCGNANDESGNGNNGTINGATLTTDRFGNVGKAYQFDGVDDWIQVEDDSTLRLENGTVTAWLKYASLEKMALIYKQDLEDPYQIMSNYAVELNDYFQIAGIGPRILGNYSNGCDPAQGGNWTYFTPGSDLSDSFWHQLTLVYDDSLMKIFIDGNLAGSITTPNQKMNACPGSELFFGRAWQQFPLWYQGQLDDIAIWNRALSSEEITQLYQIQACTTPLLVSLQNSGTLSASPGAEVQIQAQANLDSTSFRWESDAAGLGWMAIQNNARYNGADSARLQVSNISLSNHLQRFRVLGQSGGCRDTSEVVTLQLSDTCINTITVNDTNLVSVTDTLLIDAPVFTAGNPPQFNTLKVYPVPATNMLYINTGNYASMPGYSIKITRINGQNVVYEAQANEPLLNIPLDDFGANGVYFLNLYNASGALVTSRKIVLY